MSKVDSLRTLEKTLPVPDRPRARMMLDAIVSFGTRYLVGYYLGSPDTEDFRNRVGEIKEYASHLDRASYSLKFRNVDFNQIYPCDVQSFIVQFIEHVLREQTIPDYVVGCACGSSEVAMPIAGLMGRQVGFIRNSKRRGDKLPKLITEQSPTLKHNVAGRNIVCIDDYVCTGLSLSKVMECARKYGATRVRGFSVKNSHEGDFLRSKVSNTNFYVYE